MVITYLIYTQIFHGLSAADIRTNRNEMLEHHLKYHFNLFRRHIGRVV